MIKVGIVGGTGYTGAELLRLLLQHPAVEIKSITSRQEDGVAVSQHFPNLRHYTELFFTAPDIEQLQVCDVVFFATPHAVSMAQAPQLLEAGVKVIDLSADFRLKDKQLFATWYGVEHQAPQYLEKAVYGLPELNREAIKTANLVAAPGCYPTAVQLGFKPLIEAGIIDSDYLIADVKSGVSGAGREAKVTSLFAELNDSFKAYSIGGHRHQPEIEQELTKLAQKSVHCVFVPHLVPMIRGIEATLYARLTQPDVDLQSLFENAYRDEYFIDVMPSGSYPETRTVRGSNIVRIAVHRAVDEQSVIVSVVEDNLVKGASGQAVQCMNLMFGLGEQTGLTQITALP